MVSCRISPELQRYQGNSAGICFWLFSRALLPSLVGSYPYAKGKLYLYQNVQTILMVPLSRSINLGATLTTYVEPPAIAGHSSGWSKHWLLHVPSSSTYEKSDDNVTKDR